MLRPACKGYVSPDVIQGDGRNEAGVNPFGWVWVAQPLMDAHLDLVTACALRNFSCRSMALRCAIGLAWCIRSSLLQQAPANPTRDHALTDQARL